MLFQNSLGVKWYLHSREVTLPRNKVKARSYFFRKEKGDGYLDELPIKYKVIETPNGMPMVKKI